MASGAAVGQETPLQVLMPETVWQKMMAYVDACEYEINGFGYIRRVDQSTVQVEDVLILRQTVSSGSAVTEPNVLAEHITQMIGRGQDTSALRFQWHSHVRMQAYFSGTDTGTIDAYANCDWMISLVINKHEEFAIRLDVYEPFRLTVPATLKVFTEKNDEIAAACAKEVKEKVKVRTYAPPPFRKCDPKRGYLPKEKRGAEKGDSNEDSQGLWWPGSSYESSGDLWRPTRDIRPV
jgi:hypothetical protein